MTKTYKGYEVEKTSPRHWYITSKRYGNFMGPFRTARNAYEYAVAIDQLEEA